MKKIIRKRINVIICLMTLIVGLVNLIDTDPKGVETGTNASYKVTTEENTPIWMMGKVVSDSSDVRNNHSTITDICKQCSSCEYNCSNISEESLGLSENSSTFNSAGDKLTWNILRIKANLLHDRGIRGNGVKVALFDTGIDIDNQDIQVTGGISFIGGINSYDDDNGHGTAMAGILAARINGVGYAGIAPEIKLYSVKVLDKNGEGTYSNIIKGINWAIENDMDIITLSLGGTEYSKKLYEAVSKAVKNNILIIAAAGNDGKEQVMYPAAYPQVVCVGASDIHDELSDLSNYGSQVDIMAPGINIVTAGINNTEITVSGTSTAAQHIAGAAALLWSVDRSLTADEIKGLLYCGEKKSDDCTCDICCYGLLDADASYRSLVNGDYTGLKLDESIIYMPNSAESNDYGLIYAQACSHNWVVTSTTSATCTSSKITYYKCSKCQATKSESSGSPLGHSMSTTTTPPTCTTDGKVVAKCSRCSYSTTTTLAKLGHSITTTTTLPTCTTDGSTVEKCSRGGCSYSKTTTISKLSHNLSTKTAHEPTCTDTGVSVTTCSRCSYVDSKSIPALGHNLTTTTTPPTCTTDGSTVTKCTRSGCTYSTTIVLPKLGHDPVEFIDSYHDPDYGHKVTKICRRCNMVLSITYTGNPGNYIHYQSPTHTAGLGHYWKDSCSVCGLVYQSGYTGMTFYQSPTHTAGQGHYWKNYCTVCNTIESQGYNNNTYISTDSSVNGHTMYGHLVKNLCSVCNCEVSSYYNSSSYTSTGSHTPSGHQISFYCSICNTSTGYYTRPLTTYTTTGAHTPTGHLVETFCSDCGYKISSVYQKLDSCLSCTTPPSISFNNINGTILTENDIAFPVEIYVKDNENDALTCSYYLGSSTSPAGTMTVTGTSSRPKATFPNKIDARYLDESKSVTIRATAKDSIAPTGEASATFMVDKSAPTFSISVDEVTTTSAKLIVNGASDSISGLAAKPYLFTVEGFPSSWEVMNYHNFPELTPDTKYSYKVNVMDQVNHISSDNIGTGVFYTLVDTPAVTATSLSENKVKLVVKDGNPATTNYRIQVVGYGYADNSGIVTGTENWFTLPSGSTIGEKVFMLSNLAPNITYTILVSSRNSYTGNISTGTSVTALTSPDAPGNVICQSKTYNSILLGWNSVQAEAGYQVCREILLSDGVTYSQLSIDDAQFTTLQYSGLAANQVYRFKIRAKNSVGIYGYWSQYLTAKTLPTPPVQVTGVTADAAGKVLNIAWNPITDAIGYRVKVTYDGTTKEIYTPTNQTTHDTGIYNCQCSITVQAFNVRDEGDINNTSKWSNGGVISDSINCYTKANTPVMDSNVLNITPNSATIMWNANGNPASVEYKLGVFRKDALIKEMRYKSITLISDGCTVSGLEPLTEYIFKVKAINSSLIETDWSNPVSATTLMNYPGIPGGFRATAKSSTITLFWEPSPDAQAYRIERDGTVIVAENTACSYTDGGLTPETGYIYRVCAVNTTGASEWSQALTKKTLGNLPSAPVINAVTGSSISATINWSAVDGASGYDVEADGNVYNVGLDTTYTQNGLTPGSNHSYRVRTRNIYGKGEWSQAVSFQTIPDIPGIPGNIQIGSGDTQILVKWTAAYNASVYEVEIDGVVHAGIAALQYLYSVPGETPGGTEHTVRVRAVNSGGYGEWSETSIAILNTEGGGSLPVDPIPGVPSVVCSVSGSAIICVSWNEVEGASEYKLEADNVIIYSGPNTSYVHTGLSESSLHQYRVSAGNISGFSDWSNPVAATTNSVISTTPKNLTYYRESDTQTAITWESVSGASIYCIEINGVITENDITDTKTSITTVPGESYNIRVASIIPSGETELLDWSEEITFSAPAKLPTVPVIDSITATSYAVSLAWAEVTDAAGYDIEMDGNISDIRNILNYTITNLEPSTSYTFRLRAYNGAGKGEWSESKTIATGGGIPGVPVNITGSPAENVNAVTGSAIQLKWTSIDNAIAYEVIDDDGNIYPTDINEIIIESLMPGEQYNFQLRALTEAGEGPWSSRISVIPTVMSPKNVSVVAEDGVVRITWDKVGGSEAYEIELDGITVTTTDGTSYIFNYDQFYKQRTIRIRACYGTQKSEWSQTVVFNQALPIAVGLTENEEISILLPVSNADIDKYKLTLVYNPEELMLLDAFETTPDADIQSTYIEKFNTSIIIDQVDDMRSITFLLQTDENDYFTGTVSSIRFRSKITGTVTLKYGVTEK